MPSLKMAVPHNLTQEEATQRLKTFLEKMKARHGDQVSGLTDSWVGNILNVGFSTKGMNVKGNMAVEPKEVKIDGQLPFAAMMFKGRIEKTIRDELARVLA